MINVFKAGGDWKTKNGFEYTVKSVSSKQANDYLADGWFLSLQDADCIDSVCEEVKPKAKSKKSK